LLHHGQEAILVPPTDPHALANAIVTLHQEPALRASLAEQGHRLYQATCSETVIKAQVRQVVTQSLGLTIP